MGNASTAGTVFFILAATAMGAYGCWRLLVWDGRYRRAKRSPRPGSVVDWSFTAQRAWARAGALVPELFDEAVSRVYGRGVFEYEVEKAKRALEACEPGTTTLVSEVHDRVPSLDVNVNVNMADTPTYGDESIVHPVFFKDGEPSTLGEYSGQQHVVEYLQAVVDGLPATERVPKEHQLFLGQAGLGKTLLAKCFANTLNLRNEALGYEPAWFQEVFPADIPDLKALDRVIRRAQERPTVLFIDEIHDLKTEGHSLKLYLLMEEGRYKFEGETNPVLLPDVCVVGATTDYGSLHAALKRRFNRHMLEPLDRAQITEIVSTRTFPITSDATAALVARTYFSGAPWEALQLYRQAMQFSLQRKATQVDLVDVERVFQLQGVDDLGLRRMDRSVIKALLKTPRYRNTKDGKEFVGYAASEMDVCSMADNLDRAEYRESIKPRLLSRGLLSVRPAYGQILTPAAVEKYRDLAPPVA